MAVDRSGSFPDWNWHGSFLFFTDIRCFWTAGFPFPDRLSDAIGGPLLFRISFLHVIFFIVMAVCFLCGLSVWGISFAAGSHHSGIRIGTGGRTFVCGVWVVRRSVLQHCSPSRRCHWLLGSFLCRAGKLEFFQKAVFWQFWKSRKENHDGQICYPIRPIFLPCILGAAIDWLTAAAGSLWFFQGLLQ